ncbi:MAG: hypothetical protein GXY83_39635 [Rhodopirellula sp.]|nr:hypothetical protein [Rhodopirellula sp.]
MLKKSNDRRAVASHWMHFGLLGAAVTFLATGCGESGGIERTVVSGTVSYDGQPIEEGMIRFVPTKDTAAPVSGAEIQGGKYTVDAKGGVPVGSHRVEVEAYRTGAAPAAGEEVPGVEGAPKEQFLPEKYNLKSELEVTIGSDGPVTEDFDLAK